MHIDSLFDDNVIDWDLIEKHWTDLLRTAISIREGRISSVTLLRRLGNHSRRNRIYKALRELGRVVRTVTLLRYLSDAELRAKITAITNRTEAFHGFAAHLTPPTPWPSRATSSLPASTSRHARCSPPVRCDRRSLDW
jgi:TnpA family transposase